MKPIWIVDDDQSIRFVLEKALAREQFAVRSFSHPREMLSALDDDEPQVLVSDIRMPGGSGLELLNKVKARHPGLPVIIMTAYSDLDSAVSAFQGGAFEYLPKPFDVPKAVELIRRAVDESLREEVSDERVAEMPEMLGQAPAMQDVFRAIGRLSQRVVDRLPVGERRGAIDRRAHERMKEPDLRGELDQADRLGRRSRFDAKPDQLRRPQQERRVARRLGRGASSARR